MASTSRSSSKDLDATMSASTSDDDTSSRNSFVDYVPPPQAKIAPPAKYKLWACIFCLVYITNWLGSEAGFTEALRFGGWLSPGTALFLNLYIVVGLLVYAVLDLIVASLTFKIGDETYGLGPWLKQPRATWYYRYNNVLIDVIGRMIQIMEDGFAMFDAPPPPSNQHRNVTAKQFSCHDGTCERVLKIEHRINPEKLKEYRRWESKIRVAAQYASGIIKVDSMEKNAKDLMDDDVETGRTVDMSSSPSGHHHTLKVICVHFANIHYLNEWMTSPRREVLMGDLEPLLAEPDIVQVQNERNLPDAFSDLVTRQGESVPELPPKKWKVWWLTTIGLYITVRWTGSFMPYYYEQWGTIDQHPLIQLLLTTFIGTFVNSYILTPFVLILLDHWVKRGESEKPEMKEPWRTLDDGIQWLWLKSLLAFALYGGFAITWAVKASNT